MTETVETLNAIIAAGAVLLFLGAAIVYFDQYRERALLKLIDSWGLLIAFFVTLAGSGLTLLYSEVFGFVPCGLCWLQRVFLYPQVFILAVALWYRDKTAARYGIALSIPGLIVALYQYYLQMGGTSLVNCPVAAADCSKIYMFEFGFVTFPMLAVATFAFLITLYLYILRTHSGQSTA